MSNNHHHHHRRHHRHHHHGINIQIGPQMGINRRMRHRHMRNQRRIRGNQLQLALMNRPQSTPGRIILPYNNLTKTYTTEDFRSDWLHNKITIHEVQDVLNILHNSKHHKNLAQGAGARACCFFFIMIFVVFTAIIFTAGTSDPNILPGLFVLFFCLFISIGIIFNNITRNKIKRRHMEMTKMVIGFNGRFNPRGISLSMGPSGAWIEIRDSEPFQPIQPNQQTGHFGMNQAPPPNFQGDFGGMNGGYSNYGYNQFNGAYADQNYAKGIKGNDDNGNMNYPTETVVLEENGATKNF